MLPRLPPGQINFRMTSDPRYTPQPKLRRSYGASARVASVWRRWLPCVLLFAAIAVPLSANASAPDRLIVLQQDIDALLDRRLERVVPFVNWTYGWAASYANSYIVAAKVAAAIMRKEGSWLQIASTVIREQQLRAIRDRVTRPEADAAKISALIDRHVQSRIFSERAKLLKFACAGAPDRLCAAPESERIDAVASSIQNERLAPELIAREHRELADLLTLGSGVDVDFVHTLRPMVSRIAIFILRLTELTSFVVLITAGLRRIYLPNIPIVRIFAALMIAWGLDYGVLRVERLINESTFEKEIIAQVKEQNRGVSAYIIAQVETAEAAFVEKAGRILPELQ